MGDWLMLGFHSIRLLIKLLGAKKSIFLSIVFCLLALGVFTSLAYDNFLHLQAQNVSQLSVFNEIIKPLSGITLALGLLMSIISASQLVPYLRERGQLSLVQQSSLTPFQLARCFTRVNLFFVLIPILYFLCVVLFISIFSQIELSLVFVNTIILLLGLIFYSFLVQSLSFISRTLIVSVLVSLTVIILIMSLEQVFSRSTELRYLSIFTQLFLQSRDGVVSLKELIYLLIWICFAYCLFQNQIKKIKGSTQSKKGLYFGYSLIITLGCLKTVDYFVPATFMPISQTANEKLPEYYKEQISLIKQPIKITAVIDKEQSKDEIIQGIDYLKQFNKNINLNFSNRQAFRSKENNESGQIATFVSLKIGNNQQAIRYPFAEPAIISLAKTIERLHSKSQEWIVFIQGHNEPSIFGQSGRSFSLFYNQLKAMGWPVIEQNLRNNQLISDNTKLIIIANSQQEWLDKETESLINFLKRGGHLLLMREAEDQLPQALVNYIGVKKTEGTILDKKGFSSGTPHPAILIIDQFNQHPINNNIQSLVALPWSNGLELIKQEFDNLWQDSIVLSSHDQVWNELAINKSEFELNQSKGEEQKSYDLMISLEREFGSASEGKKKQRVLLVGDSSFLSDAAINNYANQQLAANMISWLLSSQSQLIESQYRDNSIQASLFSHFMLRWFFSLIFPALFLLGYVYKMRV
jgi:hypothetical protein